MGKPNSGNSHFFEDSISTLFLQGQLPVIAFSFILVASVDCFYHTLPGSRYLSGVYVLGLFAPLLSLAAVTRSKTHEKAAVFLLYLSMILTLGYLAFLIRVTGGQASPFIHMYLYLPAVVFMVTQRRHWAEIVAIIGVFLIFLWNYPTKVLWSAWNAFQETCYFEYLEKFHVILLLILLALVNRKIEKLARAELPVQSDPSATKDAPKE